MRRSKPYSDKAGQTLSIMMALGFMLLFSFLILFFAVSSIGQQTVDFETGSISEFLETCLETVSEQGLIRIGKQGGVAILDQYHAGEAFGIEYSLLDNQNRAPSKKKLEGQLSFYVREDLDSCLQGFQAFRDQGWQVESGELSVDTSVNRNDVTVSATLPLDLAQGGEQLTINQFSATMPVRLDLIQKIVQDVVTFSQSNPDTIDMSRLANSTLNVTVFPHEDALVYAFMDERSRIQDEPYRFYTALR